MKTATFEMKKVYGNHLIYPVCNNAKLLMSLTGKKTADNSILRTIELLGFNVTVLNTNEHLYNY